ncbi:MAG: hypothetical protein ACXACX_02520 [Candidatus Hodarchaeales archaeon]|jgi:hypothetical protein
MDMIEFRTDGESVSWHWSELSKEAILRKSPAIRRIRNRIKDSRKIVYRHQL